MKKTIHSKQLLYALLVNLAVIGTAGFSPAVLAEEAAESEPATKATQSEPATNAEAATQSTVESRKTRGYRPYSRRVGRANNRYRTWQQAEADARRAAMNRYHSARRWWKNPGAESRRLWNQARVEDQRRFAEMQREQAVERSETQREEMDQYRPYYEQRAWRTPRSWRRQYRYRY